MGCALFSKSAITAFRRLLEFCMGIVLFLVDATANLVPMPSKLHPCCCFAASEPIGWLLPSTDLWRIGVIRLQTDAARPRMKAKMKLMKFIVERSTCNAPFIRLKNGPRSQSMPAVHNAGSRGRHGIEGEHVRIQPVVYRKFRALIYCCVG